MAIEIFWGSGSGPSWRVLMTLEHKQIPYESHLIEFSKRQHKTEEMLAMNPRGKVPVLRDGNFSLYESVAILAYLERRFPQRPLFGSSAEETGRIGRLISECLAYFDPAADAVRHPIFRNQLPDKADEVRAAAAKLEEELSRLEANLEGPWLAGDALSAADITYAPMIAMLHRAMARPDAKALDLGLVPLSEKHPALGAWWGRMEALPEFQKTFPPHWR